MSNKYILSVLFFIPFCRFRRNNRFGGERFPTAEVVIVFFVLCHINCMEILTTIIYLFHIKTWNFLYKNPRVFYSIFLSQQTSQTSLFLIASHHQKQFSYPISRPNQLPNEKPNDNKPNNFHKINTKLLQRTYVALLLFRRQSKLLSNTSQFVSWSKLSNLCALH